MDMTSTDLLDSAFATLPDLIRAHAAERPDAVAAADPSRRLSWSELDRMMDRIAARLQQDGFQSGEGAMNYDLDMPPYIQEMAEWLDDPSKVHSCHFDSAYKGMEIMMGLCRSAAQGGQVALPLAAPADELELLKTAIADRSVLVSSPVNAKEYGV